ncbi:MAG: ribonuclease E inhibitor RraB [Gemmatimonadales bacterium]|nr:ribonuclease E inhibitor RraB [Gemmatimonadales bacterium]
MSLSVLLVLGLLGLFLYVKGHAGMAARRAADPDEAPLAELARAGSDLARPHEVEFFLYFRAEADAHAAAAGLRARGFTTSVEREPEDPDWLCLATRQMIPTLPALRALRQEFTALTEAGGGAYDGWGATVVPSEDAR